MMLTRQADTPSERRDRPWPIVWTIRGLLALIILHLAVPAIMVLQRRTVAAGIERANPALSAVEVSYALLITLIAAAIFHLLFVIAYAWLSAKIGARRRWARVVLTVTLGVATVASLVSFTASPLFRLVIPVTDLLQLALIGLLWLGPTAQVYFSPPGAV